jgi:cytochrome c oxidase subunit 1
MQPWHEERQITLTEPAGSEDSDHRAPGTFILALIFLASFAVYYFANWLWLSDLWEVR